MAELLVVQAALEQLREHLSFVDGGCHARRYTKLTASLTQRQHRRRSLLEPQMGTPPLIGIASREMMDMDTSLDFDALCTEVAKLKIEPPDPEVLQGCCKAICVLDESVEKSGDPDGKQRKRNRVASIVILSWKTPSVGFAFASL